MTSVGAVERTTALRGPIAWTVVGNLVLTAGQWACVAVIAKLLGPADVGVFALAAAVTAPLLVLTQLQLRIVLATDVRYRARLADYVQVRIVSSVVLVALVAAVAVVGGYDARTRDALLLFGLAKAFDAVSDILFGYHQRREQMRAIALSQGLNGVLSVVMLTLGVALTGDLLVGLAGFALASLVTLVARVVPAARALRRADDEDPRDQAPERLGLIRRAAPLALVLLVTAVAANVPRLVVERDLGAYALGIFAGASYVVVAAANLVNAVGNAISPRLAASFATHDLATFRRILGRGVAFGAGLALVGALLSALVGGPVLTLVYTPDYADAGPLLAGMCLAAALGFSASFLVGAATAAQRFRAQVPVSVATCAVAVVASLLLVPSMGLAGAVLATAAGYAVQLAGYALVVQRALRRPVVVA
jgi:O-antigen/teichoic acid export membrane protein